MSKTKTTNTAFSKCPICGKRPHVETYNLNQGKVYCRGTLFRKHHLIQFETDYQQPSKIFKTLINGWNDNQKNFMKLPKQAKSTIRKITVYGK